MHLDLQSFSPSWFSLAVAAEVLPKLLAATGVTIFVTLASFAMALLLGLPFLLLRQSKPWFIGRTANLLFEFIRSTPLLLQVYFYYFVLPSIGITLPAITTGVVAMAIYYGCYMSEVYRSALEAVPTGQWDAATALNFSPADTYLHLILPQLVPQIVPTSGNYLIAMIKDTPLLASIAAAEIMFVAMKHGAENFQYMEPITLCGLIFLTLSMVSSFLVRLLEHRVGRRWLVRGGWDA